MHRYGDISGNSDNVLKVAVNSYLPSPYIGRVAFFKAPEGPTGDAWDYSRAGSTSSLASLRFVKSRVIR